MRKKDETKYQDILNSIEEMVNQTGIASVSMAKVADIAGVSKSTLYVYFPDKNSMLKAVYLDRKHKMADYLNQNLNTDLSPREQLQAYLHVVDDFVRNNMADIDLIEQFANSPMATELDISIEESYLGFEPLLQMAADGVASGDFTATEPIIILSFAYVPIVRYEQAKLQGLTKAKLDQIIAMCLKSILK